ncbi:hypothetical protein CYMTET_45071, partial [Cymbomonas tetramitiformis]
MNPAKEGEGASTWRAWFLDASKQPLAALLPLGAGFFSSFSIFAFRLRRADPAVPAKNFVRAMKEGLHALGVGSSVSCGSAAAAVLAFNLAGINTVKLKESAAIELLECMLNQGSLVRAAGMPVNSGQPPARKSTPKGEPSASCPDAAPNGEPSASCSDAAPTAESLPATAPDAAPRESLPSCPDAAPAGEPSADCSDTRQRESLRELPGCSTKGAFQRSAGYAPKESLRAVRMQHQREAFRELLRDAAPKGEPSASCPDAAPKGQPSASCSD